jgi:hypothetical protein
MTCCAGVGSHRPLLDATDERANDAHVDVGLEQRDPDLARDLVDVLVVEAAAPAQAGEDRVEAFREGVEHEETVPGRRGSSVPNDPC